MFFSPQAIFKDPFRRGNNILVSLHQVLIILVATILYYYIHHNHLNFFDQVMCDAYTPAGEPIPTNKRHSAAKVFSHPDVVAEVPW